MQNQLRHSIQRNEEEEGKELLSPTDFSMKYHRSYTRTHFAYDHTQLDEQQQNWIQFKVRNKKKRTSYKIY